MVFSFRSLSHRSKDALWYVFFIATAMPINITLIYRAISSGSQRRRPTVYIEVWRNRTLWEPGINPCSPLYVANGDSEDNIYSILNLRFDLCSVYGYGNDVCMAFMLLVFRNSLVWKAVHV
jgi:hypothetical protein